jgi:hypothetical protein
MKIIIKLDKEDLLKGAESVTPNKLDINCFTISKILRDMSHEILYKEDWTDTEEKVKVIKSR